MATGGYNAFNRLRVDQIADIRAPQIYYGDGTTDLLHQTSYLNSATETWYAGNLVTFHGDFAHNAFYTRISTNTEIRLSIGPNAGALVDIAKVTTGGIDLAAGKVFSVAGVPVGGSASISDVVYGAGWNGDTAIAPSKNAVYDQMELKAPIASPALTGTPTAPTPAVGDNDTSIATTAYVMASKAAVIQSVASAATVTPTFANDQVNITAQATALDLANWSGTAIDGWGEAIRIKDNGTPRAITYGSKYRDVGVTRPTTTVTSKTLYLGVIYNLADDKFDIVSVAQEA